eukprot:TRINITY_DN4420_c0_g1_i1.p1 TRINITY_DN4420_c0_g1~~TRINITY_DN4420_c0_g1_i1.p1  ORF type:complete len:619 (+),score=148.23 TRINITY_DN4420_c0_g1_i1:67-1923(+)
MQQTRVIPSDLQRCSTSSGVRNFSRNQNQPKSGGRRVVQTSFRKDVRQLGLRQGSGRLSVARRAQSQSVIRAVSAEPKPTILVAEKLGEAGLEMLRKFGTVDCSYDLSPEDLKAKISLCDAVIIRSGTQITREVFEAAKGRLRVVGRAGVGVDNVDLHAATEYGCLVVNAPTANTVAAAEHGIALLVAMARNVGSADASMKSGKWERSKFVGTSLSGKTLAVMGFGKVGSELARRAKGLALNVIAHDPYASEERAAAIGVKLVSFEDALATADFFSLHMPLTQNTKDMFSTEAFSQMKPSARIINVARGGVINEDALVKALDEGKIAQAALDVYSKEPPEPSSPLISHPKILCTPHLGASTREAQEGVAVEVSDAVITALKGELAATAVNAPMVPAEVLKELQPYVTLAQGLGNAAVQLVQDHGFTDVSITYSSPRGDELDTRLLRTMVIKGMLERITTSSVNLVNADLLAQNRGLRISEVILRSDGKDALSSMSVSIGTSESKFSAAVDRTGRIYVQGGVRAGLPFLTKIGGFDVDLAIERGDVILVRQKDQPGVIAALSSLLGEAGVNISFMTVARLAKGQDAIMAAGIDTEPAPEVLEKITAIGPISEWAMFREL